MTMHDEGTKDYIEGFPEAVRPTLIDDNEGF